MWRQAAHFIFLVPMLVGTSFVPDSTSARAAGPSRAGPVLRLRIRVEAAPDSATLARWLRQNSLRIQNQRMARVRAMGLVPEGPATQPGAAQGQPGAAHARPAAADPKGAQAAHRDRFRARTSEQSRPGQSAEPARGSAAEGPKGPGAGPEAGLKAGPGEAVPGAGPAAARAVGPTQAAKGARAVGVAQPVKSSGQAARPDPMVALKDVLKAGRTGASSASEQALRERLRKEQQRREQLKDGAGHGTPGGQGPQRGSGHGK